MQKLLRFFVRLYQLCLSPLLGMNCRFEPSCSHYCRQAICEHGSLRGSWLSLLRVLRCNPLARPGFDPVPPAQKKHNV
ncbi:MAG: membrane protein insertion efficiency factor YidD [Alphaproteobacteria bacterium]